MVAKSNQNKKNPQSDKNTELVANCDLLQEKVTNPSLNEAVKPSVDHTEEGNVALSQ